MKNKDTVNEKYHLENRSLRVWGRTIVVLNTALEEKYPGGCNVYLREYRRAHNRNITVTKGLHEIQMRIQLDQLNRLGLIPDVEYCGLDIDYLQLPGVSPLFDTVSKPWLGVSRSPRQNIRVRYIYPRDEDDHN